MVDPAAPVGIFDSGLGGLTVARSVIDALPHESIIYFGDTKRYPYGTKPLETVHQYALESIEMLCDRGVKAIVVGCNSAASALARLGRPDLDVPLVGVIDPPAQVAVRLSRNRRIGIIGTQATIDAAEYEAAISRTRLPVEAVFSNACPRFVEFVERGITTGPEVLDAASEYLQPLIAARIDTLILGCTHYPLLEAAIQHVMGPDVLLVSSAAEAAKDVWTVLVANNLLAGDGPPTHEFFTSGSADEFTTLGRRFLGPEFEKVGVTSGG